MDYSEVQYDTLIQYMIECEVDLWLVTWMSAAMNGRTVALRHGSWMSEAECIMPKLQQGSGCESTAWWHWALIVLVFAEGLLIYSVEKD
jgi:hypothetical protein